MNYQRHFSQGLKSTISAFLTFVKKKEKCDDAEPNNRQYKRRKLEDVSELS